MPQHRIMAPDRDPEKNRLRMSTAIWWLALLLSLGALLGLGTYLKV